MTAAVQIPIPKSQLVNEDGVIDRTWYQFFYQLWLRSGATQSVSTDDLAMALAMNDATGDDPTAAQASVAIRGDTPLTWLDM